MVKRCLSAFLLLVALRLLSSCKAELTILTNEADLDCSVLMEDTYCIKVRNGQINSVKALALSQNKILSSQNSFNLSWKMPETAKGILATKIVLANDEACTSEVKSAEVEIKDQAHTFTDVKDGIYYGCVFAKARAAGLLGASNNGIRIVVETALPKIESPSEIIYANGKALDQTPSIQAMSKVTSKWTKTSGPGELNVSGDETAMPTIVATRDGSYTIELEVTNEVGGTSTKTFTLVYDTVPPVIKAIPPLSSSGNSIAVTAESLDDLKLYRWEIVSAPSGMTPELTDANSATAELSLPGLGLYELKVSVTDRAGNVASILVFVTKEAPVVPPSDTTNPSAPSAITVAAYSNTTSVNVSYTAGTDANFFTHNVKACTASDCLTGCQGVTQDIASPVTVSSLVNGSAYYICLQAVDLSANTSAYVPSSNSVTVDTTAPAAPSALGFGSSYSASATLNLAFAVGTDANFSTHATRLCASSDCIVGCTSTTQSASSPVSLTAPPGNTYYGCARSLDLANNASIWVASIGTITIDTTTPTAPSAITVPAFSGSSVNATYTAGTDLNFSTHNVMACTDSNCSTGCLSVTQDVASPVTVSSLINGTSYYICLQTLDLAGNTLAFIASGSSVLVDTTAPGNPTAVSVPLASNGNVAISFTAGTETNPSVFNIKACTTGCTVGCVGDTTTAASPGTISGAALTNGNSYNGCVQGTDLAGHASSWVQSSAAVIFDTMPPNGASNISVPLYSNSSSVAASFTIGTDANMSTHNFKACTANDCATGCLAMSQTVTSPAALDSLVSGTAYFACVQALDLAGNTSAFSFSPSTVTIDMTAPANPTAVSVPASSATSFNISFTGGAETHPSTYNIQACTNTECSAGCVGATTTAASPGTIASTGLSLGTSYYGCVQGTDLAGNASSFVASAGTVLYNSFTVTYNSNGSTGGSVPTDGTGYASAATVTVLGNTGSLVNTGYTFAGWNTASNGSGTAYSPSQTFSITANRTLYAQWAADCSSLVGGTYVTVPGNSIYGTGSFCVQKYLASNVANVPTSQAGTGPWQNINQTNSILRCAALGNGYHLITNPEWMSIGANLANVASNWSLGTVGNGTLRRGHSDNNPGSACAANASDANAYVESNCTGSNSGPFLQRRTSTLSNGAVVWDIGGNLWNWVNYFNNADKPTPSAGLYYDQASVGGSTTTPKSHLFPRNSSQSWWSNSWDAASQGVGRSTFQSNGSGGAMVRGLFWNGGANAGPFSTGLYDTPSVANLAYGFRCAYTPNSFAVVYDDNAGTAGSPPNDPILYVSGNLVTVKAKPAGMIQGISFFEGWNTQADGSGTRYAPGATFTITANTRLYAEWNPP